MNNGGQSDNAAEKTYEKIVGWFKTRQINGVKLVDKKHPKRDVDSSYEVAYEIVFEPADSNKIRLEIWITKQGNVGIGYDRVDRVASKLGVSSRSSGFAGGFEPLSMPETALESLLNFVADGRVAIQAVVLPILGVVSAKPSISADDLQKLKNLNFTLAGQWFAKLEGPTPFTKIVKYQPW